jgi:PAS domain S-box-containing protein
VYFDISYSAIRDETGAVRGGFCIVNETTDRVRFEQALRQSEERLQAIFSQSAAGIAQGDLSGRILHANARFCEILGYDEEELVGMNVRDITFADDLPENIALYETLSATGRSFDIEKRYVRKDGSLVWVTTSVSGLRDDQGVIRQVAVVAIDVSQRRETQEAERRYASIIASSNDAILGIDLNMTIIEWNGGAERLYGYSSAEALGRSVLMLVPPDRHHEEPDLIRRVSDGYIVERSNEAPTKGWVSRRRALKRFADKGWTRAGHRGFEDRP